MPAVTPDVVLFYLLGAAMIAFGIRIISRQAFPAWVTGSLLWPLIRVTPAIAALQGWAAVAVGAAAISYTLSGFVPERTWLLGFGGGCAVVSLGLAFYSTWLSRRPAGAPPPLS